MLKNWRCDMSALEWFESVRSEGERLERARQSLAMLESRIAPHSQGFEPMGHGGGGSDRMLAHAMLSDRLGQLQAQLPELERRHQAKLERATDVLYGRSGNGGLAKVAKRRGATYLEEADMLCLHYLQGEGWASVARRFEPETTNLTVWCKRRAKLACRQIDRIGMDALADS